MTARINVVERFWTRVDKTNSCWLWTGNMHWRGYAKFKVGRVQRPAHRWAYEHFVGPIPDGLELDHLCRVRHCVNPAHLEPTTTRENILRGIGPSAQNARKTHCAHGHEFNEQNTSFRTKGRRQRVCLVCKRARYAKQRRATC